MSPDMYRMAREAGFPFGPRSAMPLWDKELERFAALVRADERKACCSAEVLNAANINGADLPHQVYEKYTAAIRARGQQ